MIILAEMAAEDWIAIASIFATLALAILTIWINRRDAREEAENERQRHQAEIEREANRHREFIEREDRLRREQRLDQRHIEFTVECDFFGPVDDQWLAEIRLCAHNKGQTVQRFSKIFLRVRGIPKDSPLTRWDKQGHRAFFPEKVAEETNIIPEGITYFTEPGIRQVFTYVTTVPADQRFILVQSEFDYYGEEDKTHDCERVFEVPSAPVSEQS